ncbi:MAG: hypothetical protein CMO34_01305, partial [Verrucomicrobia bacterium]|nr:hypothetical protein [Verrucomicrobiota bacterium]
MASNPLIIAHRGASGLAPENTLSAFKKAIDVGVDRIEIDSDISLRPKGGSDVTDIEEAVETDQETVEDPDSTEEVTEPYQTISATSDEISFYSGKDVNFDLLYT